MRGSFTVEATLNFTCIIICFVLYIYMGLYLHDKAILENAAACAAQRGRMYITENQIPGISLIDWSRFQGKSLLWRLLGQTGRNEIEYYAAALVQGKLLVCEEPEFSVYTASDQVTVSYNARTTLKGLYLSEIGITIPYISGSVTDSGIEGEEFVRLVKAIAEGR